VQTFVNQAQPSIDFSRLSFLIVDDQPYTRRMIRSMLIGFGSREIYECGNGAEALELVRTALPSIIITDLVMPILDGVHLISALRAPPSPAKHIPVIVLSGYLTKSATLGVREARVDELLVKPVSPKALHEHISRIVLRNERLRSPSPIAQDPKRSDPNRTEPTRTGRSAEKKGDDLAFL